MVRQLPSKAQHNSPHQLLILEVNNFPLLGVLLMQRCYHYRLQISFFEVMRYPANTAHRE